MIRLSSIKDLQKIGNDPAYPLNGNYELANDIDASDTVNWNGGRGFSPIGDFYNSFTGNFDGKGHKITGLYINRPNMDYVGLFGSIDVCSEVKNIGLENIKILGDWYVGGLVGWNCGTVSGCYSTGSVSGRYDVGGLVGWNEGTVSNCYSTGSVSGIVYYVGGLAGENWGTVTGCYSTGSVSGVGDVGGLVGYNWFGTVSGCYSTGSVSGGNRVGGLVGKNYGTVSNSFAMGAVTGSNYVGGLIGHLYCGNVINTYSTGLIGSSGDNIGGLIGYIKTSNNSTVTSSYWDTQTSGMTTSAGGEGKTTAQMKQQSTFIDWDFMNIWGIIENNTYPYLLWQHKGE